MHGQLLVCERSEKWAIALRRQLQIRVHETRSVRECWSELRSNPASIVVWEATAANLAGLPGLLVQQHRVFPGSRTIVASEADVAGYKWLWRVSGAVEVVESRRQLQRAVRVIEQHLKTTSTPKQPLDEILWAKLPWSET